MAIKNQWKVLELQKQVSKSTDEEEVLAARPEASVTPPSCVFQGSEKNTKNKRRTDHRPATSRPFSPLPSLLRFMSFMMRRQLWKILFSKTQKDGDVRSDENLLQIISQRTMTPVTRTRPDPPSLSREENTEATWPDSYMNSTTSASTTTESSPHNRDDNDAFVSTRGSNSKKKWLPTSAKTHALVVDH